MRCFPLDTIKIRKPLSMQFFHEMLFVEKSRLNATKDIFDKKMIKKLLDFVRKNIKTARLLSYFLCYYSRENRTNVRER